MPKSAVEESRVASELFANLPILPEATTSRVVVNNDLLRHVLFSMAAEQVLTEHASPRAVIVNLLEGEMEFTVGGEDHTLVAGDVVYLAPGDRHALRAISDCHMSLTLVDTTYRAAGE